MSVLLNRFKQFSLIASKLLHHRCVFCKSDNNCLKRDSNIRTNSSFPDSRKELLSDLVDNEEQNSVSSLIDRYFHTTTMSHQVLIIQPFIRHGIRSKKDTNPKLMLQESTALVETLGWKVVDSLTIGLPAFNKPLLFGSGKRAEVNDLVNTNLKITAVFVSLYQLTVPQRLELEKLFTVPVIDRYNLVLQIFYQHSQSKESRLQVALAEIPYLKNRLLVEHQEEQGNKHSVSRLGEQYFDKQRFILKKLERSLKKKINQLQVQRYKLRDNRKKQEVPTIAVIGYTNCGKTSLIKAITGSSSLQPKNQLFATLDVTCHGTKLPSSNMESVFIDTVGFISDIPTPLIASFRSTLEDAIDADLLLHVIDYSNPDWMHQSAQVHDTLRKLKVPSLRINNMLTVGNKIDKVPREEWINIKGSGSFPVSATLGYGLDQMVSILEEKLISVTDRIRIVMKVRPGEQEWEWLHKHCSIGKIEVWEADNNFNLITVVMTKTQKEKFKALFI